ncbi:zinc ribbon domain-containing protein [Mycobacteroides franklinii]|uniref:zinc ribbon domain-containing protein n=1 Tax=Mycobacteroides franklinii TaxID=948102 RepID=UPI001A95F75D|nr:zinc ribbon domain-containing protein [Mycobacteroides franklinii]
MRGRGKSGGFYFYFVCRGRQSKVCDLPYIRASQAEHAVAEHYRTVTLGEDFKIRLSELFAGAVDQSRASRHSDRTRMKKRLTELDRQEDRYVELALDPDWPKEKITAKLRQLRDERKRLIQELDAGVQSITQAFTNVSHVLDYLDSRMRCTERAATDTRRLSIARFSTACTSMWTMTSQTHPQTGAGRSTWPQTN